MYQYFVPASGTAVSNDDTDFTSDLPTSIPVPLVQPMQQPVEQQQQMQSTPVKNCVLRLNEKFPNVIKSFTFEELEKPTKFNNNTALFKCSAQIEGVDYSALGSSKKSAKQNLAEQLLPKLLSQANLPTAYVQVPKVGKKRNIAMSNAGSDVVMASDGVEDEKTGRKRRKLLEKLNRDNYVQVFMEMCNLLGPSCKPDFQYTPQPPKSADAKPHELLFDCTLRVGDKTFSASGSGKKFIKQEAIKRAFKEMFDIDLSAAFAADDKQEMFDQLAMIGRNNLRQHLQVYAARHSLTFKVESEEVAPDPATETVPQKALVKQHKATCQFGDVICSSVSSLSKKDCLDQLFMEVIAKHFGVDVSVVRSHIESKATTAKLAGKMGLAKSSAKTPVQLVYELCGKNNFTISFTEGEEVAAPISTNGAAVKSETETPLVVDRSDSKVEAQSKTPGERCYMVKATTNDSTYIGYGKNKKAAKQDAAVKVLKEVFSLDYNNNKFYSTPDDLSKESAMGGAGRRRLTKLQKYLAACENDGDKMSAARIAFYAREKYAEVLSDFNVIPSTTFSAFLLSDSQSLESGSPEYTVISLASGNRSCSLRTGHGVSLHDCHGAVLARRGLFLYFYDQLALLADPNRRHESIFEDSAIADAESQSRQQIVWSPYRLKKRYALHFYDSRLPPGDASADQYDTTYRNCLRCYQPDGVATVPIPYLTKQMSRQPYVELGASFNPDLRSMSLSDKMLKWNILGVQGALLSVYIEPIYLESIVIGQNYCKSIVKKAVFSRFDLSMWLPGAKLGASTVSADMARVYNPRCPKLYAFEYDPFTVTQKQRKQWTDKYSADHKGGAPPDELVDNLQAPTDYALSWQTTTPVVEFLIQESGLELYKRSSRLSKQSIFDKFTKLASILPFGGNKHVAMHYSEAKQMAAGYALAKNRFINLLKTHGLGSWLEKSANVGYFSLPWLSD